MISRLRSAMSARLRAFRVRPSPGCSWLELSVRVIDVGDAPLMPAAKLRPVGRARPLGRRSCIRGVIAAAFDDRFGSAVANAESFSRDAVEVRLASNRAVQRHIADDDVLVGLERDSLRRVNDDRRRSVPCRRSRSRPLRVPASRRGRPTLRSFGRRAGELQVNRVVRQRSAPQRLLTS